MTENGKQDSSNIIMIDSETGEKIGTFNRNTHYLRNKQQDDIAKKKNEVNKDFSEYHETAGNFVWSYPEKIQELIKSAEFTKSDITMIFYIGTFVSGTGYITRDNNTTKLTKADIQERLDVGRNLFNTFYNKLIKHGILIPSGDFYKWNETYNFYGSTKGKADPRKLVRSYISQIRRLYRKKKLNGKRMYSPTRLYPVFALVPYLHHSTNVICKNPEVMDVEEIEYFSLSEIAELLDLSDSKKMSSSLSSILLNGQTTFIRSESKNEKYLKLNPRIFWRGTQPPSKELQGEFDMVDNNRQKRRKR